MITPSAFARLAPRTDIDMAHQQRLAAERRAAAAAERAARYDGVVAAAAVGASRSRSFVLELMLEARPTRRAMLRALIAEAARCRRVCCTCSSSTHLSRHCRRARQRYGPGLTPNSSPPATPPPAADAPMMPDDDDVRLVLPDSVAASGDDAAFNLPPPAADPQCPVHAAGDAGAQHRRRLLIERMLLAELARDVDAWLGPGAPPVVRLDAIHPGLELTDAYPLMVRELFTWRLFDTSYDISVAATTVAH